jgi:uroporphyrinogen decarboxylase
MGGQSVNNRERVLKALSHVRPDRAPYDIRFTVPARERMAAYYGDPDFESKLGNCFTWLRPHLPDARFVEVAPNIWQDEFGVRWDRHIDKDIGVVCNRLVTADNVSEVEFPDPNDARRYARFDEAVRADGETAALVSLGFSLFERAWTLAGMENVLMAMAVGNRWIDVLLDRILEFKPRGHGKRLHRESGHLSIWR